MISTIAKVVLLYFLSTLWNALVVSASISQSYFSFVIKPRHAITYSSNLVFDRRDAFKKLDCAASCLGKPFCVAFYAIPKDGNTPNGEKLRDCWLMKERVSEEDLTPGNGTYGYLHKVIVKSNKPVPSFANCDFQTVTRTEQGKAAAYDCSRQNFRMTNIGVLYDEDKDEWPTLNSACSSNIAAQFGLAGTLMKITESATKTNSFNVQFFCQKDEYHWGDAECDEGGNWKFTGNLEVGCVSTSCMKNDRGFKSLYKGTVSSPDGVYTCQAWISDHPQYHNIDPSAFVIDNSKSAAKNYCRDPDNSGAPWCYTVDGPRWKYCKLPRCKRKYINLI